MNKQGLSSPFIEKYEKALEKNAHSRAFAPLAECYRKIGMIDKAFEILRLGLRHHPDYILGLLGIAFCHIDNKNFEQAYDVLAPLVTSNRENLRLQKAFGRVCVEVGENEEALDTFKYLLFMNPRDKDIAIQVEELERDIYREYHSIDSSGETLITSDLFEINELSSNFNSAQETDDIFFDNEDHDDWQEVALNQKVEEQLDQPLAWEMKKIEEGETLLSNTDSDIKETKLFKERSFVIDDKNLGKAYKTATARPVSEEDDGAFVTHTLVDLYCSQGHFEKATNLLKQIIQLNPTDTKSMDKLSEILSITGQSKKDLPINIDEQDEGHERLMGIIDETLEASKIDEVIDRQNEVRPEDVRLDLIEKKLSLFHQKLCDKAFYHKV